MDGQGRPWPDEGPPLKHRDTKLKRGSMWPAVSQCNWTQEFDMRVVGALMPRPVMSDEQRWGRQREPSTLEHKEQGFSPACRTSAITVSTRVPQPHTHCGPCGLFFRSRLLSRNNTPIQRAHFTLLDVFCGNLTSPGSNLWLGYSIEFLSKVAMPRVTMKYLGYAGLWKGLFKKKIKVFHDSSVFSYMKILGI